MYYLQYTARVKPTRCKAASKTIPWLITTTGKDGKKTYTLQKDGLPKCIHGYHNRQRRQKDLHTAKRWPPKVYPWLPQPAKTAKRPTHCKKMASQSVSMVTTTGKDGKKTYTLQKDGLPKCIHGYHNRQRRQKKKKKKIKTYTLQKDGLPKCIHGYHNRQRWQKNLHTAKRWAPPVYPWLPQLAKTAKRPTNCKKMAPKCIHGYHNRQRRQKDLHTAKRWPPKVYPWLPQLAKTAKRPTNCKKMASQSVSMVTTAGKDGKKTYKLQKDGPPKCIHGYHNRQRRQKDLHTAKRWPPKVYPWLPQLAKTAKRPTNCKKMAPPECIHGYHNRQRRQKDLHTAKRWPPKVYPWIPQLAKTAKRPTHCKKMAPKMYPWLPQPAKTAKRPTHCKKMASQSVSMVTTTGKDGKKTYTLQKDGLPRCIHGYHSWQRRQKDLHTAKRWDLKVYPWLPQPAKTAKRPTHCKKMGPPECIHGYHSWQRRQKDLHTAKRWAPKVYPWLPQLAKTAKRPTHCKKMASQSVSMVTTTGKDGKKTYTLQKDGLPRCIHGYHNRQRRQKDLHTAKRWAPPVYPWLPQLAKTAKRPTNCKTMGSQSVSMVTTTGKDGKKTYTLQKDGLPRCIHGYHSWQRRQKDLHTAKRWAPPVYPWLPQLAKTAKRPTHCKKMGSPGVSMVTTAGKDGKKTYTLQKDGLPKCIHGYHSWQRRQKDLHTAKRWAPKVYPWLPQPAKTAKRPTHCKKMASQSVSMVTTTGKDGKKTYTLQKDGLPKCIHGYHSWQRRQKDLHTAKRWPPKVYPWLPQPAKTAKRPTHCKKVPQKVCPHVLQKWTYL